MEACDLRKSYRKGPVQVPVLKGVDVQVGDGEFMAIVGKSGSGKSTLLHLLATLDAPDSGEIHFQGRRIDNLAPTKRDGMRNQDIGVVFQFYHLLPELTTLENTILPAMIGHSVMNYWSKRKQLRQEAIELLDQVGLSHRLKHRPSELSGGEMQRVAIARALLNRPSILLADEPTGNLDRQTGVQIMDLLRSLNRNQKLTIVMVTHDSAIAQQTDRVVQLVEGRVSFD
ncbi:MAG: ABC transporter ATP-binding protein [Planctomycetaceae bacterium]|nr:ABC transporter ATP-binding protein [Planctomycetaceae bacterium]